MKIEIYNTQTFQLFAMIIKTNYLQKLLKLQAGRLWGRDLVAFLKEGGNTSSLISQNSFDLSEYCFTIVHICNQSKLLQDTYIVF